MIAIDLANAAFLFCLGIGGILLLLAVLLDDELGSFLDYLRLRQKVAGAPLGAYILGFVTMFGVGGLFGTQILHASAAPSTAVALVFAIAGLVLVWAAYALTRRRSQAQPGPGLDDLIGHRGRVSSSIRAGNSGAVSLALADSNLEFPATSDTDIPAGSLIVVTEVDSAGSGLVVTLASHSAD